MRGKLQLAILLLTVALFTVVLVRRPATRLMYHVNVSEINTRTPNIGLLLNFILSPWSIEEGTLENVTRIRRMLETFPLPYRLKTMLNALLNYTLDLQDSTEAIREDLKCAQEALEMELVEEGRKYLSEAYDKLVNSTIILHRIDVISNNIAASYPQARSAIQPRVEALKEKLNALWRDYRSLKKLLETLAKKNLIATQVLLELNATTVYPGEPIGVRGLVLDQNGSKVGEGKVLLRIAREGKRLRETSINLKRGEFEASISSPRTPARYAIYAIFIPMDPRYASSVSRATFSVKPYDTQIVITRVSSQIYPGQGLEIGGLVSSTITPTGKVEVRLKTLSATATLRNGTFCTLLKTPYDLCPGSYELVVSYIPDNFMFAGASARVKVQILKPADVLKLNIATPSVVLSGTKFKVTVTLQSPAEVEVRVRVFFMGSVRETVLSRNQSFHVELATPIETLSGKYKIRILAIPRDPRIGYKSYVAEVLVVNTYSLMVGALSVTALIGLLIKASRYLKPPTGIPTAEAPEVLEVEEEEVPLKETPEREIMGPLVRRLRKLLYDAEFRLCSLLDIEIKPGDTHREILGKIREKNRVYASILAFMVKVFEEAFYGLKKLRDSTIRRYRALYGQLVAKLRAGK